MTHMQTQDHVLSENAAKAINKQQPTNEEIKRVAAKWMEAARSGGILEAHHYQRLKAKHTLMTTDEVNLWELGVKNTTPNISSAATAAGQPESVVDGILRAVAKHAITPISPLNGKTPTPHLPLETCGTPTQQPPAVSNNHDNDPPQQLPSVALNTSTQELSSSSTSIAPQQELTRTPIAAPSPHMDINHVNQEHIGLLTTAPSHLLPGSLVARTARPTQALHINTSMPPPPPPVVSWQAPQTLEPLTPLPKPTPRSGNDLQLPPPKRAATVATSEDDGTKLPPHKRRRTRATVVSQMARTESLVEQNIILATALDNLFSKLDDMETKIQSKVAQFCADQTEDIEKRTSAIIEAEGSLIMSYNGEISQLMQDNILKRLPKPTAVQKLQMASNNAVNASG